MAELIFAVLEAHKVLISQKNDLWLAGEERFCHTFYV